MYSLKIYQSAEKDWAALDSGMRDNFLKILERRLIEPRVVSAQLSGNLAGMYKIKLQKAGFRLVYEVQDEGFILWVVAVGKRADGAVYRAAAERISRIQNP
jgi:mRNA interferase RelE/StbE